MNAKPANFITREISKETADEWGLPEDLAKEDANKDQSGEAVELAREERSTGRWSSYHDLVFRAPDDGATWSCTYDEGVTEMQDYSEWDDQTEITLTRVEPYESTVIAWRRVKE